MKLSLKDLPSVHQVLLEVNSDIEIHEDYLKFIINKVLNQLRGAIKTGSIQKTKDELFKQIVTKVWIESAPRLVNVINGTGIVLHTGFGRVRES